jgi:ABC-type phosphate/phosphonate transport system permease subunit
MFSRYKQIAGVSYPAHQKMRLPKRRTSKKMNLLRAVPMFVQLLIFGIAISLGAFSIIPWWAAGILAILSSIVIFGGGSSAF